MASWMWLRTQVKTVMDVMRRIGEILKRSDAKSRDRRKAMTRRKMMLAVKEGPATRPRSVVLTKSCEKD